MNFKQKLSILASSLLPALALSAYFLLGPAPVRAQSCPGGTFNSSCYRGPGVPVGCGNGAGYCYAPGSPGYFVFCPPHEGPGGPGICESGGTVCCTE
jgi:hypothetical protein